MKKPIFLFLLLSLKLISWGQITAVSVPDSAKSIVIGGGASVNWSFLNPLDHDGTSFTHSPICVAINGRSDYLYFYDFGFSIPSGSLINGVFVKWNRGSCNAGSYYWDTLSLAYNGAAMGDYYTGAEPGITATDSAGGPADTWGNSLSYSMINDNSFGVFYNMADSGICTFGFWDLRLTVYYTNALGVQNSQSASFRVGPNPATDQIRVSGTGDNCSWKLFNSQGILCSSGVSSSESFSLATSGLERGIYFLHIEGKRAGVKKIVLE